MYTLSDINKVMFKRLNKSLIIYLILSLLITTFVFRDLIANITHNLIDWRDYSYVVWVINQAIDNFKELGSKGLFNGNAFYPNKNILLFSDLLWPQAFITYFYSLFTDNIILQFNLLFFTTIFLNTVSIYAFWKAVLKEKSEILFASLITNFSPFLFLQLSHFQMISYWPFFFALSYLFKTKRNLKDNLIIGILLSIQFYAAVYWSIFLILVIAIFYFVILIKNNNIKSNINSGIIISGMFLIMAGPVLFKYIETKKLYNIVRNYSEYVSYSAQISDYFFTNSYGSFISNSKIFTKINSLNNHSSGEIAGSPSIIVILLFMIGIVLIKKKKSELSFHISLKEKDLFFLILTIVGLIFSLGPRLSFNGNYLAVPLPFTIALKYLIIFDPIRATARFSALFYIGVFYFAIKGLKKIKKTKSLFFVLIFASLYLLELIPINLKSEFNDYYSYSYKLIEKDCNKGAVLIEYPFNQNFKGSNVVTNLKYKASQLTATVNSKCNLVNGYAGFDPLDYTNYTTNFNRYIDSTESAELSLLLQKKNVNFIKINKNELSKESLNKLKNINIRSNFGHILFNDDNYLLINTDTND